MSRVRINYRFTLGLLCACALSGSASAELKINPYPNQPEAISNAIQSAREDSKTPEPAESMPVNITAELPEDTDTMMTPEDMGAAPEPEITYNEGPTNLDSFDIDAYYASFAPKGQVSSSVSASAPPEFEPRTVYEIEALSEDELMPMAAAPVVRPPARTVVIADSPPEAIVFNEDTQAAPERDFGYDRAPAPVPASAPAFSPPSEDKQALRRLEQAIEDLRADISTQKLQASADMNDGSMSDSELAALKAENQKLEMQLAAMQAESSRVAELEQKVAEIEEIKNKATLLEAELMESQMGMDMDAPAPSSNALQQLEQKVAALEMNNQKLEAELENTKVQKSIPPKPLASTQPVSVDEYYDRYASRQQSGGVSAPEDFQQSLSARMSEPQFVAEEFVEGQPMGASASNTSSYEVAAYEPVSSVPPPSATAPEETIFMTEGSLRMNWQAMKGKSVRETLAGWSDKAGVQFVWDTGNEFAVLNNLDEQATYEGAVEALLGQYGDSDTRPLGSLHIDPETGQRILLVQASNNL